MKVLDTLVGMEADEHALQWEHLRTHYDLRVRAIADRASREPSLRRLFPYAKLSNVGFSTSSEYPYEALAYVISKAADEYEALAADKRRERRRWSRSCSDDERARELRQVTPFTFVISPRARWALWRRAGADLP